MKLITPVLFLSIVAQAQMHWKSERENGAEMISIRAFGEKSGVAITGYGRGLKTKDGGETWMNAGGPAPREITSSCFLDSTTGWMLHSTFSYYRVFRTLDGGSNWTPLKEGAGNMRYIHFSDREHGWGVGWKSIMKTIDGGLAWKAVPADTSIFYNGVFFVNASTGWVAREDGRLIHTRDSGLSWKVQDSSCPNLSSSMQFLNEDTGWVGVNTDTVQMLRTTDGGRNWSRIRIGATRGVGGFHFINSQTGWFASKDSAGIFRTDDGGLTWVRQWRGAVSGFTSIDFSGPVRGFAAGADGIIIGTVNGGLDWVVQNSVVPLLADVHLVTPEIGWAVGYDKIVKTINGGINWIPQRSGLSPIDSYLEIVRFLDTSLGWTGGRGVILKTADGGLNWRPVHRDSSLGYVRDIQFLDKQSGWAVGDMGMLKSTDGGDSWVNSTPSGINNGLRKVNFISPDTGWIMTASGTIFKTSDGGKSWINQNNQLPNAESMFFLNGKVGWAVGGAKTLVKTNDGGKNWVEQWPDTGRHVSSYAVYFSDARNGWMLAGSAIYASKDGGVTWIPEPLPPGLFLTSMSFLSPDYALAVGSESLVRRSATPFTGIRMPPKTELRGFIPANRIKIHIGAGSGVEVSGFDMRGRLLGIGKKND